MKILCLYNNEIAIEMFQWLKDCGHETVLCSERLDTEWCLDQHFDLAVSYTYRYIITPDIIEALNQNVVNIHNSVLPFNRGADPNIWSFIDNTPRGVTLHYIDAGLDTGDIIAQSILSRKSSDDTLASTYKELDAIAKKLFKDAFRYYPFWDAMRKKACGKGTYHRSADAAVYKNAIETNGSYNIRVADFKALAAQIALGGGEEAENMQ